MADSFCSWCCNARVQGGALYIDGMQFALADTQGGLATRGVLPKGTKRK
jgi:hypothetical protein